MRLDDEFVFNTASIFNGSLVNAATHAGSLLEYGHSFFDASSAAGKQGHDSKDQWSVFAVACLLLVFIEVTFMNRGGGRASCAFSLFATLFWLACAAIFGCYIYTVRGEDDAIMWSTGYVLEWLLSVDNLFVFHRIFTIFGTPENQRQTALFWGIIGAVVFRLALFWCAQELMHNIFWMHYVFGLFLVYTGLQAMADADDELDNDTPLFSFIARHLPYVDEYHPEGALLFIKVVEPHGVDENGVAQERTVWKGTRLLLVVICLEVTDVLFAIDSVSVIVAQIPSVYLALSACVFSMIGVRSLYSVADNLVRFFWLVSYGCALILIFIGMKLIVSDKIHVSPMVTCAILLTTLAISVLLSVLVSEPEKEVPMPSRRRSLPLSLHAMPYVPNEISEDLRCRSASVK